MPILALQDYVERLVAADITATGIQWSTAVDTTTADTYVTVLSKTIEPGIQGDLLWLELGLTCGLRAVTSATADLIWKWQARNKGGTWVDLHTAVTETNIGTTEVERTMSGYFALTANINHVPIEIQLLLQCNETNEGRGRVKNSSYARLVYKGLT